MTLEDMPLLSKFTSGLHRLNLHWRLFHYQREVDKRADIDDEEHPVVFFNASTRLRGLSQNAAFSLLAAWGVQLAGVPVIHFACHSGMSHCVLGTIYGGITDPPPCQGCIAETRRFTQPAPTAWFEHEEDETLRSTLEGVTLPELKKFQYKGRSLGSIVLPSLRWALRRHHLRDDDTTRFLFSSYILSAQRVADAFSRVLDRHSPQAVVVFNGLQYPEAVAREVAKERGVRVITHEVGFQPLSAFFTDGEATSYPINIPDSFELSEEENDRLDNYLERRFQGKFTMAGIQFWPEMKGLDENLQKKIRRFDGVVPVFTNVVFDTSQPFSNTIYSNMFEWLDVIADLVRSYPDILFVLRAHPDEMREGKESKESVAEWVRQKQLANLENVIFYGPQEHVSSYELIEKSTFVMVYNSSIGLEASLLGTLVLCGGRARYTRYPTVIYPNTKKAYLQKAKELLEADRVDIPDSHVAHARRFLYYQFFKASLPFDHYLAEHPSSGYVTLKKFPISHLERQNSSTMRTIVDGILKGDEFVLDPE